jgi:hypothetical protein
MAKTKTDLFKEGVAAGVIPDDSDPDDFTVDELQSRLSGDVRVHERQSASEPIVAADGHVVLSQEDIDARA